MRKILFFLLTLCILLGLCLTAQAEDAPHPHSDAGHCICGGAAEGVGDHQCSTVANWTPLSESLDFGKLESGAYYLTCDIKLTASPNIIGDMTEVDSNADGKTDYYTLDKAKTITLCLNGYTLSTSKDRVFKGLGQKSVLNICDCSYDGNAFYGTIIGGSSPNGPICYTYSTSTLNIFGGNFTVLEHSGRQHGGLFVIAQDRWAQGGSNTNKAYGSVCNIYNGYLYGGIAQAGGNINVMHASTLNLYGGTIADGSVHKSSDNQRGYGGNIHVGVNASLNILGTAEHPVLITGGSAEVAGGNVYFVSTKAQPTITTGIRYANSGTEVAFVRNSAGTVTGQYLTLAEALEAAAAKSGSTVYMVADSHVPTTLTQSVPIDLNGHHITNLTLKADLYAMDSVTQFYTDPGAGTLECTPAGGQVVTSWKTADLQRYLALQNEGKYSFHRIYLSITKLSLRPNDVGFGYKAHFAGSETVKNALDSYGFRLWLDGRQPVTRALPGDKLTDGQELSLLLSNFDVEKYAEEPVYANVFFTLKDGTEIQTNSVAYTFRTMCEKIDSVYASQPLPLRRAIDSLSKNYSHTMMSWDIASYHHAKDSIWYTKGKTNTSFNSMLKKVTIGNRVYYNVPAGTYYLTEDVDLGSKTLRIAPNTTVTICLNGHTITGSSRVIRNNGTLNLCDCHTDDYEGGITSTQTIASEAVHGTVMYCYNNSITNLYGGKLTGTGANITSGGAVAVAHDGGTGHETDPAAVFNMYGGEISSTATAEKNGGAVVMYHASTFNLYDGIIRGTTANMGGAISVGNGTFRMYGGTVTGGTATTAGGNIHVGENGTLELYGGTITGGKASEGGSGVYILGKNTVLAGTPQVIGNRGDDLLLSRGSILSSVNLRAGANVKLTVDGNAPLVCNNPVSITGLSYSDPNFSLRTFNGKLLTLENGVALGGTTSGFSAGFSKVLITPEEVQGHYEGNPIAVGVPLSGFGISTERANNQYVGYDLYVTTTAVTDAEGNTILIAACDLQRPQKEVTDMLRAHMSAVTGVPVQNIYINASHSHSTPDLYSGLPVIDRYKSFLAYSFAKSARLAMADRAPATIQTGSFEVGGGQNGTDLNHTRHYYYFDANGEKQYFGDNFNSTPSGIDFYHVTKNDPTMHLLKFDRETKTDILLCNWRAHPTMTGRSDISNLSSDFVGPMRDKTEELTGMHVAFIQGAAGNQNTSSRISGEGLKYTSAQPSKSQARANYYGHTLAAQVSSNLDCLASVASGTIRTETYTYAATVNHAEDSRIEDAKHVSDTYWSTAEADRKALLNQYNFTSVYHAGAVISKYNLGATKDIELNVFSIGDTLGFYTAPGELWNTISVTMEDASPFAKTFTVGYCNGDDKYFLYGAALTYANYESYYSRFVSSTAQDMINYWKGALTRLQNAG